MERRWVTSPSYRAALAVLVEARSAAGMTQRELAERLGKPRSFVSKVEDRVRRVDMVEVVAWARAAGVDPACLITRIADAVGETLDF